MKQYDVSIDSRVEELCVYCGEPATTRDHVPSKAFLDKPYPDNIPVVPCCSNCNNQFSKDEEYFACVLECLKCNSTDITKLGSGNPGATNILRNYGFKFGVLNLLLDMIKAFAPAIIAFYIFDFTKKA